MKQKKTKQQESTTVPAAGKKSKNQPEIENTIMQNVRETMQAKSGEPDPAWLLLDNQLCFSAYALSREIIGLYRPHLELLGITYTQYITLMVLWEVKEISMKHLGERLFLDSGTLTPLLKKLVQAGLAEKQRDPDDERSVLVRITEKGMDLRTDVLHIPAEILCGTGLDVETAIHLREVMKKMANDIRQSL